MCMGGGGEGEIRRKVIWTRKIRRIYTMYSALSAVDVEIIIIGRVCIRVVLENNNEREKKKKKKN